jgi:hypothetical protein
VSTLPTGAARLVARARTPWGTVLVASAAVLLVVGAGRIAAPAPEPVVDAAPVVEPVASADLLCPVTVATKALTSAVSAGVAPLPGVDEGTAALAVLAPAGGGSAPERLEAPGTVVVDVVSGKSAPPRTARATGSWSAGFGADQTARSGQGATRGLAAAPCARPVTEGWLVGGASTVGRTTQVLLVNDDDRPAQVDLLVYGPEGPIPSPAGSGVVVPALSRSVVRLAALAPDQAITAIHVVARSGRIAASALETAQDGLTPRGMAVLPLTQAGERVVIPSIPAVTSARLLLLAPDAATDVSLKILTADGSFAPAGIETLSLEQGLVASVDITDVLAGEPSGILVEADTPVVAAVVVSAGGDSKLSEMDVTAGTPALTAPGIVVGLAPGGATTTIAVASAQAAATVRLDLYAGGSSTPAWTSTVQVGAGGLVRTPVPVTAPDSFLVVVPVSGGPVHVTRELLEAGARGPMVALAPVLPTRATTTVPPVVALPASATG